MPRIQIKPLSVNACYQGRRFRTPEYNAFRKELLWKLPKRMDIPEGKLEIRLKFGLSSPLSDYDGCIKGTQDVIFEHFKRNDRDIFRGIIEKEIVPKGQEYIDFEILPFTPSVQQPS